MQRPWRQHTYNSNDSFQWASNRLDRLLGQWQLPRNVQNNVNPANPGLEQALLTLVQSIKNQTEIMSRSMVGADGSENLPYSSPVKQTPTVFTEDKTATLLAYYGLK